MLDNDDTLTTEGGIGHEPKESEDKLLSSPEFVEPESRPETLGNRSLFELPPVKECRC